MSQELFCWWIVIGGIFSPFWIGALFLLYKLWSQISEIRSNYGWRREEAVKDLKTAIAFPFIAIALILGGSLVLAIAGALIDWLII